MRKRFFLLLILALLLTGCSQQASKKYTVIATVFPAYDWVREILGDNPDVELRLLSDKGIDLHSYQATAQDMVRISDCDLFLYVGGESDASGADAPRAMAEVVRRRYGSESTLLKTSPRADLYICDGGITQLRAARALFKELGVGDIATIGLAKQPELAVLGEAKKLKLLKHFKSVYAIAKASVDEIAAVAGVNDAIATEILRRLKRP